MPLLILLRHGQSTWNLENRFTGSTDIDLSPLGRNEAATAGIRLKPFPIDLIFTSMLKRAIHTADIVLAELAKKTPIIQNSALNERNYGDLQGLNKADTIEKYGEKQVQLWRRSFETAPPNGESLKDTFDRVFPFYKEKIEPELKAKNILIIAHGNSLRALIMYLENISSTGISNFTIATGIPRVYEFDKKLKLQKVHYIENNGEIIDGNNKLQENNE